MLTYVHPCACEHLHKLKRRLVAVACAGFQASCQHVVQLSDADRRELSSLAYVEDGNYDSVQRIIVEVTTK